MKRNSKGMLSIIVIAILTLSFIVPFVSVSALDQPTPAPAGPYEVGDTITLTGAAGQVTSGSEVKVYWDYATGASAWLLNTTTGDPDGSYEVNIDVPETEVGDHYIWIVDVATGLNNGSLDVNVDPTLEVDVTSGLPGDTVTLTGYGFDAEAGFNVSIFNITAGNMDTSVALVVDNDEETDVYGSFEIEVDIPASVLTYDDYFFNVSSAAAGDSFNVTTAFTIGASITLTEDEGPEGFVIEIVGRGFEADQTLTVGNVTWDGPAGAYGSDGNLTWVDDPETNADGEFTGEIVAPSWGEGDWRVQVTDGTNWAEDNFTIDGTASIEVDPTYGSPGAGVTVTGANFTQIAGTEVTITLNTTTETVDTLGDGTFTVTITAPATEFKTHDVGAVDEYLVNATDTFKIGLIAMLINPESGPSGTEVSLTGIGFTNGLYNMTFEDDLLLDNQAVTSEQISDDFVVPTVDPGTYTVTVIDEDENTLSRTFTVTATTSLTGTPSDIAVGYNMSIYGEHFTEVAATALTFYAYNATWGMTTAIVVNETTGVPSTSSADGNFTGYWVIPDTMLLGNTYTVNVTDANDLYAEFDLTIVEESVEINPNKGSYSLGDTITFTIKATFAKANAYLEVVDPNEERVFISTFAIGEWEDIDDWQVVRIPNQVQDGSLNPLMIPSDGTIGTWVWTLYDVDDDVIKNGTIEILPTSAAQIDARLSDVEGSIADLAGDIAGVTTDLEDDIDALSSEIGDVASDVDGLKDDIVGDLADDIAAATAAGNAASDAVADLDESLSDLEDSMGDIADASNSALDAAQVAADAAADAATAAEGAGDAAKGLTSLVYGAIGASLIAALAAIVSLMQISKKIAG